VESTALELTRDDIFVRIDQGARRRLGMSGVALLRAWREGRLADPGDVADLLALAALLADDGPALDSAGG
jgi:hypothetical protein